VRSATIGCDTCDSGRLDDYDAAAFGERAGWNDHYPRTFGERAGWNDHYPRTFGERAGWNDHHPRTFGERAGRNDHYPRAFGERAGWNDHYPRTFGERAEKAIRRIPMRTPLFAIVAVLFATIPTAALADFAYTFQVPTSVSNIPSGATIQAICRLYPSQNGAGSPLAEGSSQSVNATNGIYSGTLTVKTSASAKPGSYMCFLVVSNNSGATWMNVVNGSAGMPQAGWTGKMYAIVNLP